MCLLMFAHGTENILNLIFKTFAYSYRNIYARAFLKQFKFGDLISTLLGIKNSLQLYCSQFYTVNEYDQTLSIPSR